jgi:hypothetical protein
LQTFVARIELLTAVVRGGAEFVKVGVFVKPHAFLEAQASAGCGLVQKISERHL